ncbi:MULTISPECIES: hypothetical protein [unclassified Methanosarcina]|uniref:hypothetical protein n=1 Tax=unclassified Methanosarcina TaxID=2644672 RepID=UPI0025F37259|nr:MULTISPECIES: hypothetical protein [unclassified Methanosarcina]
MLDPASGVKKLGKDMIIKKKLGLRVLILAMLLVSIAFVPAASAEKLTEKTNDTAVDEIDYSVPEPEPIITLNIILKFPYWYLLKADEKSAKNFLWLYWQLLCFQ